jgi:hypothetical protein
MEFSRYSIGSALPIRQSNHSNTVVIRSGNSLGLYCGHHHEKERPPTVHVKKKPMHFQCSKRHSFKEKSYLNSLDYFKWLMLMQLLEAVLASSINTMIVVALYGVRTRYRKRVKLYGPFAYKLDDSGALKEISADYIPIGVVETLRQRILSEVKVPESTMLRKPTIIFFALIIFVIQLIILLMM